MRSKTSDPVVPMMVKVPRSHKQKWVDFAREKGYNGYSTMVREAVREKMAREADDADIEGRLSTAVRSIDASVKSLRRGIYANDRLLAAIQMATLERLFLTFGDFGEDPARNAQLPEFHRQVRDDIRDIFHEIRGWHRTITQAEDDVVEIPAAQEESEFHESHA